MVVALDVRNSDCVSVVREFLGMLAVGTKISDKRRGSLQHKEILLCKSFLSARNESLNLLFLFFTSIYIKGASSKEGSTFYDEWLLEAFLSLTTNVT